MDLCFVFLIEFRYDGYDLDWVILEFDRRVSSFSGTSERNERIEHSVPNKLLKDRKMLGKFVS